MENLAVPKSDEWPVDPQIDVKISEDRIWIDGCFDFAHHGLHAHLRTLSTPESLLGVRTCWCHATSQKIGQKALGWDSFRRRDHGQ